MIKYLFPCCFAFLFLTTSFSQQLSDDAEISILSIGTGEGLYELFGHTAIRVKDNPKNLDIVYDYGKFDFETPFFYLKFTQGKLNYQIGKNRYQDVLNHYKFYNRSITAQILNLSKKEKQKLFNFLKHNYKPINRNYLYDFFYDNCATRIRDVVVKNAEGKIVFSRADSLQLNSKTFRDLLHEHVGLNSWNSFGIDLALGSVTDKTATDYEYMFLPKYIYTYFADATKKRNEKLVKKEIKVFEAKATKSSNLLFSPVVIFSLISLLIIYITYKDFKKKTRTKWLDVTLFALTGLAGLVILFLWFGTDHWATGYNYNLLWAFPLNIILILQVVKTKIKTWFKGYLKFLMLMQFLMVLHWFTGVQDFAITLIPLIPALFLRYLYLVKYLGTNVQGNEMY